MEIETTLTGYRESRKRTGDRSEQTRMYKDDTTRRITQEIIGIRRKGPSGKKKQESQQGRDIATTARQKGTNCLLFGVVYHGRCRVNCA